MLGLDELTECQRREWPLFSGRSGRFLNGVSVFRGMPQKLDSDCMLVSLVLIFSTW